jgi:phosphatidate cytidylyltransferase
MNNFWQRALTGIVFTAVIIALTLYGEYSFLALLSIIAGFSLYEYYKIVFKGKFHYTWVLFILSGIAMVWMKFWFGEWALYAIPMVFSLTAIAVLFSPDRNWKSITHLIGGILYIALPLFFFHIGVLKTPLGDEYAYSPYLALNLFVLIWCSDTFAYLCGRAFGKHKLFEKVSPGKTWEGFAGGLLLSAAFSLLLAKWFDIPYGINVGIAISTVVFGTLGDLVESMLKREFGIKDSGNILPGHGGMLDRFDALLISLPFTTVWYHFM